ncbi:MAG: hypothetical protein K2H59_03085 [Muribaculaceae bacterium]|nr:hypothetical protein [Muribaculaceae bacterium]
MKNGKLIENVEIKLPKYGDKFVSVKIDGEKKKINADSIDYIILWSTKYPDNKHLICWHTYGSFNIETGEYKLNLGHNSKKGKPSRQWFALNNTGKFVNLWSCFEVAKLRKDNITLSTSLSSPFFFQKQDGEFVHIPYSVFTSGKTRKWLSTFFSDDEVLVELLSDKSKFYSRSSAYRLGTLYTPYKYEDIVKLYIAGRKKFPD